MEKLDELNENELRFDERTNIISYLNDRIESLELKKQFLTTSLIFASLSREPEIEILVAQTETEIFMTQILIEENKKIVKYLKSLTVKESEPKNFDNKTDEKTHAESLTNILQKLNIGLPHTNA